MFATDFEHTEKDTPRLVEFAKNTDLLIYDGHFTDEEYVSKIGWGHSTWQEGIRIANRCGAKRLILTHHHPLRTDSELESIEQQLKAQNGVYSLAKAKEEVVL